MILNFLLLAGLTNLILALWLDHFLSIEPFGILESKLIKVSPKNYG
ncbi:hypothetical protein LEP1GSC200_2029 [Leptospira interrogans serovar Pomona str. CSL10083]|nr:hypothetical protein LEP1GSC200_2029 [Leptospira interrogans serovar Pomona str. CSL10083]